MKNRLSVCLLMSAMSFLATGNSVFAEDQVFSLTLKDHKFSPNELTIPADTKVKITVKNLDVATAEFISNDFNGGKVILGGQEASFFIGPLKAGQYEFYDEYHEATTKSRLIVK